MCGSTCFGRLSAHHQEHTTALRASGFTVGAWRLERCWSWSGRPQPTPLQPPCGGINSNTDVEFDTKLNFGLGKNPYDIQDGKCGPVRFGPSKSESFIQTEFLANSCNADSLCQRLPCDCSQRRPVERTFHACDSTRLLYWQWSRESSEQHYTQHGSSAQGRSTCSQHGWRHYTTVLYGRHFVLCVGVW
jgi:hypothetical protein